MAEHQTPTNSGSSTALGSRFRHLRKQARSAIKRSGLGSSSHPLHPGSFTHASDSGLNFPSSDHLDRLLDYYKQLPEDARSSAKHEQAFDPFSFSELPDPSCWTCKLSDVDVRQIVTNVKSAADVMYGEKHSENSFDWGSVREQPKYAQLWIANLILSTIDADLKDIHLGQRTDYSSRYRDTNIFSAQMSKDTEDMLVLLGSRATSLLRKIDPQSAAPSGLNSHHTQGGSGVETGAGVLEESEGLRKRTVHEQLARRAKIVQHQIATFASNLHYQAEQHRNASARAASTQRPTTQRTQVDPTHNNPSSTAAIPQHPSVSSTVASHPPNVDPRILPPGYPGLPETSLRDGNTSIPRGAPEGSTQSYLNTGTRTLGCMAGVAAGAWVAYEVYKRSEGGYADSVANSMASWWSGDHDEE